MSTGAKAYRWMLEGKSQDLICLDNLWDQGSNSGHQAGCLEVPLPAELCHLPNNKFLIHLFKNIHVGAGEMAQQARILAAHLEDLGTMSRTHILDKMLI